MTADKVSRVVDYLEHMLTAIERVEAYTINADFKTFEANTLLQDAVIRNFEIVGEAANKIRSVDPAFTAANPDLKLDLAYRMRNALIHGYDTVNLVTLWNTIQTDFPALKASLLHVLMQLKQ